MIAAPNSFPSAIEVMDLGEVNKICSVPVFLSYANIFMVKIGIIKVKIVAAE